jgi:hypothetical protein
MHLFDAKKGVDPHFEKTKQYPSDQHMDGKLQTYDLF